MNEITIERIEKRFKQDKCNHSTYKMLPVWGGIFGICWEYTKCGIVKQELEGRK